MCSKRNFLVELVHSAPLAGSALWVGSLCKCGSLKPCKTDLTHLPGFDPGIGALCKRGNCVMLPGQASTWRCDHFIIILKEILWTKDLKRECHDFYNLKILFNKVEPQFKKRIVNFDVCVVWWCSDEPINSKEYTSFEIGVVTIKISMTKYHHLINCQTYGVF